MLMSVYHMNCASDCLQFQEAAFGKQKSDSQAHSLLGGTCYFFKTMFMKSGGEHSSANNF